MNLINREDFLNWVKKKGFQVHIEPDNYFLALKSGISLKKSWAIPESIGAVSHFLSVILKNVDNWEKCYVFKTDSRWGTFGPSGDVWANLIHKIGIPEDFEGAIDYDKSELVDLLSLLCIQTSFMWCGSDQFFVVFDHAQQLIFVDEDRNLHLEFVDERRLNEFVSDLSSLDYPAK